MAKFVWGVAIFFDQIAGATNSRAA